MDQNSTESRPSAVVIAARLMWLSAAITAVGTAAAYAGLLAIKMPVSSVIPNCLTVGFLALCAVKINAGRNWARWVMLVVFVLGSLMLPIALVFAPQMVRSMPGLAVSVGLLQFVIQFTALVLVFIPASKVWFQAPVPVAQ